MATKSAKNKNNKIDINGDNIIRLTDTLENETYACYSPDNNKIAFISDKSSPSEA